MQNDEKTQDPDQEEGRNPSLEHAQPQSEPKLESQAANLAKPDKKVGKIRGYVRARIKSGANARERKRTIRAIEKKHGRKSEWDSILGDPSPILKSQEAKEVYGDDIEKFRILVEVAQKKGEEVLRILINAKDAYGSNHEMLKIFAAMLLREDEYTELQQMAVKSLAKAKPLYGDDIAKLEQVRDMVLAAKHKAEKLCTDEVLEVCAGDIEKFRIFAEIAEKSYWAHEIEYLAKRKDLYEGDNERMKMLADFELNGKGGLVQLIAANKDIQEEDNEMLTILGEIWDTAEQRDKEKITKQVINLRSLYSKKPEMLRALKDAVDSPNAIKVLKLLEKEKDVYGENPKALKSFIKLLKERRSGALIILLGGEDAYEKERETMARWRTNGRDPSRERSEDESEAQIMRAILERRGGFGDNQELWWITGAYAMAQSPHVGNTEALMEDIAGSQMSPEILKELLKIEDENHYAYKNLIAVKEAYGSNLEKFRIFVELAGADYKIKALAKLERIYGDDTEKLRKTKDLLLSLEDQNDAQRIGEKADLIGEDIEKLEIFVEAAEKNGSKLFNEFAELFIEDKEELRKLANATEGTDRSINHWISEKLLNCKDYIRDARSLEIIFEFAKKAESYSDRRIDRLIETAKDWGGNIEMLETLAGMLSVEDENITSAVLSQKEAYGSNPEMLRVFVDIAKETEDWQSIQRLGEARESYEGSPEMLKIIKEALDEFGYEGSLFAAIVGAKSIYGDDLEMLRTFMSVAKGEATKDDPKYKEEIEIFKVFMSAATCEEHPRPYIDQVTDMQAFGATMPICEGNIELIKLFSEIYKNSREHGARDNYDKRPLNEEKEAFGRDKIELARVMLNQRLKKEIIQSLVSLGLESDIARTIAEVSEKISPMVAIGLLNALEAYRDNPEIFSLFKDLAKSSLGERSEEARRDIIDTLGEIGENLQKELRTEELKAIVEIGKKRSGIAHNLVKARKAYKDQPEVFSIFEDLATSSLVGQTENDRWQVIKELADAYEGLKDKVAQQVLKECAEIGKTRSGIAIGLFKAWKASKDRPEIYDVLKDLAISPLGYGPGSERDRAILISDLEEQSREVKSQKGLEILKECADIGKTRTAIAETLFSAWKVYENEPEIFAILKKLATRPLVSGEPERDRAVLIRTLVQSSKVLKCEKGPERLVALIGIGGDIESILKKIESIRNAQPIYEDDEEHFEIIYNLAKDNKLKQIELLILEKEALQGDTEMLKASIEVLKNLEEETFKQLVTLQSSYKGNVELFRKFAEHIPGYLTCTKILDAGALEKYANTVETEGEQKAKEYLETLPQQAKGMVSSEIPREQRALPEYQYLVRYVFPDGNYSTYEKNLACGDQMEHVDQYTFNREGYPVVLTGLKGYVVKEGATPNNDLIQQYTERLGKIREFVSSRGPNNEALQEAFSEKIEKIFQEKAWEEFKGLEDLTIEEKMLCLFLGEAVRRSQKGADTNADPEICDLIIEYKYAFHEDLEAYIQRSADTVKSQKDKASQNYMLLSELSTIYGENVKHHLRHSILEKFEESENKDRIIAIFSSKIGQEAESADLSKKQWKRVDNTLTNPHIPEDKRFNVLYQQMLSIFSSNIKFETKEEETEFKERVSKITEPLKEEFTTDKLREILPELYKLRNLYRSGINEKLQELFTQDINKIFEEIAKYEEDIEQEAKETSMGGEKHKQIKKSAKKRNIRGFFTKNAEAANARMGAYLCIAGDESMWKNEKYFEFVLVDEETNKCVGTVMLINIETEDGKKYLWFGPNPFESFLDVVSSEACYNFMHQTVCNFAQENDFDGVVVPSKDEQILGQCTNRGGDFPGLIKASRLKDKKDNLKIVKFGKTHLLSSRYGYSEGALVWERT
ncbi:hypothetical protein HOG17_00440 [Candidatus Peregrinibacteria bacterium]|jgi:hypothetical protein|nr:hypothetical protein [Candidatus Peregrinibacteria bacterium]MBT4147728.1 hypothetical protein [Candidatus Peregrinibacteria bacterium]MBT4366202.1 hypothetical protein [Candidatus Peregrinibacteria bacterium]MBT4455727.1 hypothetical protein [Candidatus Peregrinibacteria bacterium]